MNKELEAKKQYSIYKCRISEKDPLFAVFDEWAHLSNNLYNETLFVIRQLFTGLSKDKKDMSSLESTTINSVLEVLKSYGKNLKLDKDHRLVNYYFMDHYFKKTFNENYNSSLPEQSASLAGSPNPSPIVFLRIFSFAFRAAIRALASSIDFLRIDSRI